jgi:hypothetical protein
VASAVPMNPAPPVIRTPSVRARSLIAWRGAPARTRVIASEPALRTEAVGRLGLVCQAPSPGWGETRVQGARDHACATRGGAS